MLFDLAGRVAIVTGGGTGIGAAMARGLARAGSRVVLLGRREAPVAETAQQINAECGEGSAIHFGGVDIAAFADAPELADAIITRIKDSLGDGPTILVNNAGLNVRKSLDKLTPEHWSATCAVTLSGPTFLARACAPTMQEARYGRIINIASLQSTLAFPNSVPYAATKTGTCGLTRALAEAYSPRRGYEGITCNAIAPGFVETDLTKSVFDDSERSRALADCTIIGRNSVPEDLVGAAIFFASPASSYVTGQTLNVDGGFSAFGLP